MITTVTANPAVDYSVQVGNLELDEVNRAQFKGAKAGGKGINVAQAVNKLGAATQALGCVGGRTGEFIVDKLQQEDIATNFNWTTDSTRINVKVLDKEGQETKINLEGRVAQEKQDGLKKNIMEAAGGSDIIVLAGSLPQEFAVDFYFDLVRGLKETTSQIFLDASGQPLKLALPANPDLIKPNQKELEELCGRKLSLAGIVRVSRELVNKGVGMVLVSRGEEGAVLTTKAGSWQAIPPQVKPVSTVGAGDSVVAGIAVGELQQQPIEETFRFAIAESIATILRPGAEMGTYEEAEEWQNKVKVKKLN